MQPDQDRLRAEVRKEFIDYGYKRLVSGGDIEENIDAILALNAREVRLGKIAEQSLPLTLNLGIEASKDFKAGFHEAVKQIESYQARRITTLSRELTPTDGEKGAES